MKGGVETSTAPRRISFLAFVPFLVAAAVGGAFWWGLYNSDDALPSTMIGRPVPEFTLPAIEGRQDGLSSADLIGQVSLVNFWASWCVPCRVENPLMVELAATGTVSIFGINYKDSADGALSFLDDLGDPFTRIGADISGQVAIDWGVYGLPETFVIDADGRIAYKHVGPFNRRMLEDKILPVVARLQAEGAAE